MAVTMADVARAAGVSPKTVSNVLNGYRYIRPDTRDRVNQAVDALGYRFNLAARNLRRGQTGLITLAVPDLQQPYFGELTGWLIRAAERQQRRVLVMQTGGDRQRALDLLQGPDRQLTDGIILSPVGLLPEDERLLLDVDVPLVLLGERFADAPIDSVSVSNRAAADAVATHLLSTGRRRIALLGTRALTSGSAHLRELGYRDALARHGIELDEALVWPCERWRLSTGAAAVDDALRSGLLFDAVFAMDDSLALGVLHSLHAHRLSVPADVAVAGIDDIEDSSHTSPTLTSVAVDNQKFAESVLDLLDVRIQEVRSDPPDVPAPARHVAGDFRLLVRESTAPAGVSHGWKPERRLASRDLASPAVGGLG